MNAMATVLRKHADGSAAAWQNVDLLAELKANPGDAADLIRQIGRVSKKVEDSAIKFGKQTANQYDVSRAIATSIGRVTDTAGNGYSLVANLAQLKQLTNDMETLVNVPAAGQLRKSIALIRRLRSDAVKTALGGQSGYLFEITEVASELRAGGTVKVDFSVLQEAKTYNNIALKKTDLDLTGGTKAVELKTTIQATGTQKDFVEKLMKYDASGNAPIEVRTLDAGMENYVNRLLRDDVADTAKKLGLDVKMLEALHAKITVHKVTPKYNHPGS
jgi:hypothetical protein